MKKLLVFFVVFCLLIIIPITYFYSIWTKEDNEIQLMKNKVIQEVTILKYIDEEHYFTGERELYVFIGRDHLGNEVFIWTNSKEKTQFRYLEHKISEKEIRNLALNKKNDIKILRITPGIINNTKFIYEVLFEDKGGRLGYQYYSLIDGNFIKMYRLGKG